MKSSIESTEEWPLDWPDSACQFAKDANIRIAELIAERDALKVELAGKEAVIKALENRKMGSLYNGEDMIGDSGFGTTEHALKSAREALHAIADMDPNKKGGLATCISIAQIELTKDLLV